MRAYRKPDPFVPSTRLRDDPVRWLRAGLESTADSQLPFDVNFLPVLRELMSDRVSISDLEIFGVPGQDELARLKVLFPVGRSRVDDLSADRQDGLSALAVLAAAACAVPDHEPQTNWQDFLDVRAGAVLWAGRKRHRLDAIATYWGRDNTARRKCLGFGGAVRPSIIPDLLANGPMGTVLLVMPLGGAPWAAGQCSSRAGTTSARGYAIWVGPRPASVWRGDTLIVAPARTQAAFRHLLSLTSA